MITFSIRHRELIDDKKLNISLNRRLRQRIYSHLVDYVHHWMETAENGWNYNTNTFEEVTHEFRKSIGEKCLKAYVDDEFKEVKDINDFLIGTKPESVLDFIEIMYIQLRPDETKNFTQGINEIFKTEENPLRFLEGEFVRINSDFLESEINAKTLWLLKENGFEKAHLDFQTARRKLSLNDFDGSIVDANNALESLLKKILNHDKDRQKDLKKALLKSGLIPDYFQGFSEHFENLLQSAFTIANKSSRHGKKEIPDNKNKVYEPVASFLLHLVGSLIVFIMERYLNKKEE